MRSLAVLAVVAALLVPAAADARPTCKRHGTRTVASNHFARVFESLQPRFESDRVLYGCLRSKGKAVRLADAYDDDYVISRAYSNVRLTGRFVAWAYYSSDASCKADCPESYPAYRTWVAVRGLKQKKTRVIETKSSVVALVLTASGAVAWIEGSPGAYEVRTPTQLLDSGNVDPKSLSRSGATVAWTKDGAIQSATLR